jgi:hypothetical protein
MKHEFEVDDIVYVVTYDRNHFSLYVDGLKSKKKTYKIVYDDFFSFNDDGPLEKVFYMSGLVRTKNPMKVYVNVARFVKSVVGKKAPYYFTYAANEGNKNALYAKFAKRIADKYGYYLEAKGGDFKFFKIG